MRECNKPISCAVDADDFIQFVKGVLAMTSDKQYKHAIKVIEQRDRQRVEYDRAVNAFK